MIAGSPRWRRPSLRRAAAARLRFALPIAVRKLPDSHSAGAECPVAIVRTEAGRLENWD